KTMWILLLIFVALFLAVVLIAVALGDSRAREIKVTASRLESIAAPQSTAAKEESASLKRAEQLSAIPWLNRLLQRFDIVEPLRLLLYQADVKWTVGRLLLIAAFLACVSGSLVELRTRALFLAFIIGGLAGTAPFLYVLGQR